MITFATKSVNTFYVMNTPAKGLEAHNNFVAERIIENDHDKASNVQITGKGCRSKDANQKQCRSLGKDVEVKMPTKIVSDLT